MYTVTVLPQAQRDLERLDPSTRRRVGKRIDWLAAHADSIKHLALTGDWARFSKYRVGDYRIIYQIVPVDKLIVLYRIAHRREVYD